MSSNTTFSSQGNFNRPEIVKLKPQKDIVNILIFGTTLLLLSIPFISSISHSFGGEFKYSSPNFLSLYPLVLSTIFIFSFINLLKNFYAGFSKWYEQIFAVVCNILYITSLVAFIIITIEINNNTNWVKNTLWDFSEVHTRTEKNSRLDLCIQAYFGIYEWKLLSSFTFITSLIVFAFCQIPIVGKNSEKMGRLILKGPFLLFLVLFFVYQCGFKPWYLEIHSGKADVTCPTK